MKDLERFGGHLEDCLAQLLAAAKKADRKRASSNGSSKSSSSRASGTAQAGGHTQAVLTSGCIATIARDCWQ